MRHYIFSIETETEICTEYVSGKTCYELAKKLNCHPGTIRKILIRHRIQRRTLSAARKGIPNIKKRRFDTNKEDVICVLYKSGQDLRQIAVTYKCDASTVRNILQRHGIKCRPSGLAKRIPTEKRFRESYQILANGCWEWQKSKVGFGYGHLKIRHADGVTMCLAHRFSYEFYYGPIPPGHLVHHKCGNKACVNPTHLALRSPKEHGHEHQKTTCRRGHRYTPQNTYIHPKTGWRHCRTCQTMSNHKYINSQKPRL